MNILVITTRDIYTDNGERTLMLGKDRALKKKNINLIYYSFRRNFISDKTTNMDIVKKNSTYEIFYKKNYLINNIEKLIKKHNVKLVVISGAWLYIMYKQFLYLKNNFDIKISIDYQGALEELIEYKAIKGNYYLSLIFYKLFKYYENKFFNIADGVEVVSQNAVDYITKIHRNNSMEFAITHCGINEPTSKLEWSNCRKKYREIYNLSDDIVAYVYVGGISKWQNVEKMIKIMNNRLSEKFYIFTSPKNQELLRKNNLITENIHFDFKLEKDLQCSLCAFDRAFLLRDNDITNYVAFPNKYSDYINARLRIIVKDENLGCIPVDNERKRVILKINNLNTDKKVIESSYYDSYIKELTYDNMIEPLVQYYNKLNLK